MFTCINEFVGMWMHISIILSSWGKCVFCVILFICEYIWVRLFVSMYVGVHAMFFFYLVNWRIVIYNIMLVFARRQHESAVRICVPPHPESPSPPYPFRLSQKTGFGCLASCIKLALVIYFTRGNVYALMLFSQIIPPSPSSTESKSLFFTSMSPLLPCM